MKSVACAKAPNLSRERCPQTFPMKRPVLDIRGLVVHRDGTLILDRLDWRVQRGERAGT